MRHFTVRLHKYTVLTVKYFDKKIRKIETERWV